MRLSSSSPLARRTTLLLAAGLVLAPTACSRVERPSPPLELRAFRQAGATNVALNELFSFHFSDELERTSVTPYSLRITDPEGNAARGRLQVDGARLTFEPELPLAADLGDGGLRPGTRYTVEVGGFPRPDGVRSVAGEVLAATLHLEFRTAERDGEAPLFLEAFSERAYPLFVVGAELGPLDPVVLECGQAIDPTSVRAEDFELIPVPAEPGGDVAPVPLQARVVASRRDLGRIELRPAAADSDVHPVLAPGAYYLRKAGAGPRNLGGREIGVGWSPPYSRRIEVRAQRIGREVVAFRSASRRWSGEPAGFADFDGTAYWPDRGAGVTLRYPAAAGDGGDGDVSLERFDGAGDVHATHLVLPQGARVDLSAASGLVVLRSQGPLEVRGRLVRRVDPARAGRRSLAEEFLRASHRPPAARETLSAWLERARASGEPWTVLISGGELRVPGEIEVDGPLLLAAGGWIRISGRVEADEVWKTPGGGHNVQARRRLGDAPLELDPPATNPLRRPLSVGVLSVPIRPSGGVRSWRPATVVGHAGIGRARVEFLGLADREREIEEYGPVDDPGLLDGCDAIRLLIRLEVPVGTGEAWDPPRVERVELSWNEPPRPPARAALASG